MAYFRCTTGGSGKGNTLVVTCADDLAGATITCTNGTKTYRKTCPSTAPYEVTFYGLMAGTWTVSTAVSGNTYTTTVVITDYEAELGGFSWRAWVDLSKNYTSSDFTDLDDLLSDETAVRELMSIHACVDYLAGITTTNADVETIINNDLCAKWINNRDYALDTLYANTIIKGYMDTADKYFYGEWVITDNTTTPPTWGAKGNAPVMTSNTAPYGEASSKDYHSDSQVTYYAYHAFSNDIYPFVGTSVNTWLQYKFANPVCVKEFLIASSSNERTAYVIVQGSNDGFVSDTHDLTSEILTTTTPTKHKIENDNYYLYYRIYCNRKASTSNMGIQTLQFYGRELSVSVPTMTGNTTPYGEAVAENIISGMAAYSAFDNNPNTYYSAPSGVTGGAVGYIFNDPSVIKKVVFSKFNGGARNLIVKIQTYNGSSWEDLSSETLANDGFFSFDINSINNNIKGIRLYFPDVIHVTNSYIHCFNQIQFYGLDYSEREFEEGVTKKWLYDHGLELETLTASGYSISGVTLREATKEPSQIYFDTFSSDGTGFTFMGTANAIDLTDYSYLMIRSGNKGKARSNNANFIGGLNVKATKSAGADGYINIKDMYYVNALDVSSFNQSEFATISSGAYNSYYTITELWLE